MRKITTVISIFFLFNLLHAQKFFGGITAGLVGSQVAGDQLSGFNKAGICGGFLVGVNWTDYTATRFELLYFQKGSRQNAKPDQGIYNTYIMRLNYLEIPLLFTFKHISHVELETGLSFGFLTKNKNVEYDEYGVMPGQKPFRKYELSFNAAMNYQLSNKWKVHIRYNNSIIPIRDHPGGVYLYWWDRGQYNIAILLGIQYYIL